MEQLITDFDRRVRAVYELTNKVVKPLACSWHQKGKYGITTRDKEMNHLQDLGILYLYMAMLEWKAWEQNTFFLKYDDNNCPIWQYPSTVVDPETLSCIMKHFSCICTDIRTVLRAWGIYPVGVKPDGIDYMHIESGYPPCDNNIFQIGKTRGNDVDPLP
jgi:hypothetical protein